MVFSSIGGFAPPSRDAAAPSAAARSCLAWHSGHFATGQHVALRVGDLHMPVAQMRNAAELAAHCRQPASQPFSMKLRGFLIRKIDPAGIQQLSPIGEVEVKSGHCKQAFTKCCCHPTTACNAAGSKRGEWSSTMRLQTACRCLPICRSRRLACNARNPCRRCGAQNGRTSYQATRPRPPWRRASGCPGPARRR
jgi:hypothetical protein